MSNLIFKCVTKATTDEGEQRKYGPNWVTSRRSTLKVFEDHIECGNWQISFDEIENAVLFSFKSLFLRIPGYILTIESADRTYHFGLNGWAKFWRRELPFPAKREFGKIKMSWFSICLRLILVGYIGYSVFQWAASR